MIAYSTNRLLPAAASIDSFAYFLNDKNEEINVALRPFIYTSFICPNGHTSIIWQYVNEAYGEMTIAVEGNELQMKLSHHPHMLAKLESLGNMKRWSLLKNNEMKRIVKVLLIIVAVLVILVSGTAAYIYYVLPDVGAAPSITIGRTAQRIERGKYLVNSVAACMVCHANRNFDLFAGPVDSASFGAGGAEYGKRMGFPGTVYSRNITPYALHNWTDGELLRALIMGVRKDGTALFPIMPYKRYAQMDREDIYAIIVYLRSLKPISSESPERKLDFPLNFIVNTIPTAAELNNRVDSSNTIQYGNYLANAASCIECHSQVNKGSVIPGTEFAGGRQFNMRTGVVVYSPNITPDKETGIGNWTRETFIQRFKMYEDSSLRNTPVKPGSFNTPMPWITYSSMTSKDLSAIYDYLQTLKPVKNQNKPFKL